MFWQAQGSADHGSQKEMSLSLTVTGGGGWEEKEGGKDRAGWGGGEEERAEEEGATHSSDLQRPNQAPRPAPT